MTEEKIIIQLSKDRQQVFDIIRKKYVKATPEELVRQHFIKYLILEKGYPKNFISVEMSLKVNQLHKKADIVVFNKEIKPVLIVECKAPEIVLNQKVFDQIFRYNLELGVSFLVVTNGRKTFCLQYNKAQGGMPPCKPEFLKDIPTWKELKDI